MSCATKKKFKALKIKYASLEQQLDTTRQDLAKAFREWQKIKEQSSMSEGELQLELNRKTTQLQTLNKNYQLRQKEVLALRDSLQKTQQSFQLLQEGWGAIAQENAALEQRAKVLQQIVLDSLAPWQGSQLFVVRDEANVRIEIGDSLLFGGYYYVNSTGQKLLKTLANVLLTQKDYKAQIQAYSLKKTTLNEVWKKGAQPAISIAISLGSSGLKPDQIEILNKGYWDKDSKTPKPPIFINLLPLNN